MKMGRCLVHTRLWLSVGALILFSACTRQQKTTSSLSIQLPATSGIKISESVSASSVNGWGLSAPASTSEVTCYMVMIEGSDLTGNVCKNAAGALIANPGFAAGLTPANGTLTANLHSGARTSGFTFNRRTDRA